MNFSSFKSKAQQMNQFSNISGVMAAQLVK